MNLYSSPEKFALTPVGEVEWGSGGYSFDLTVVYRRDFDGRLAYIEDSGCSCPSPFEDKGIPDLTLCAPAELQSHLEKRQAERVHDYCAEENYRSAQIAELMRKVTND